MISMIKAIRFFFPSIWHLKYEVALNSSMQCGSEMHQTAQL
jgi:hypothetical protein